LFYIDKPYAILVVEESKFYTTEKQFYSLLLHTNTYDMNYTE